MTRAWALLPALLLAAACTAPGAPSASPVTTPSSPVTGAPSTPATGIPRIGPLPDYTGHRPMPASDSGHMLWPTSTVVDDDDSWSDEQPRYGFLNEKGKVVVPPRYERYEYCRDKAGRVSFVVASAAGRKADVLSLSGAVLVGTHSPDARCGPVGDVVIGEFGEPGSGGEDGVLEAASGRILLPRAFWRSVAVVRGHTVNVSGEHGEYFLDLLSGHRTQHAGWLQQAALEHGAPGMPATRTAFGGRVGYVALSGRWELKPQFIEASAFRGGYAVVEVGKGRFTFLDAHLRRAGGEWTRIEPVWRGSEVGVVSGYVVSSSLGDALLGADLRVIIPRGNSKITCEGSDGACSVLAPGGGASLVVLPEGTVAAMPEGFTQALGRRVVADQVSDEDSRARRVLSLDTGVVVELSDESSCTTIGAWVVCRPRSGIPSVVLIDAHGRQMAIESIAPVVDPVRSEGPAYYWVLAGRYQGFIDSSGAWCYRESRYTRVEE